MPSSFDTESEYRSTVEVLKTAAAAYYSGTGLDLTDAAYDAALDRVRATEVENPSWVIDHGLFDVAAGTGAGDVPHTVPMLSLNKATTDAELEAWWNRLDGLVGPNVEVVVEPKLDGIAISAEYRDGKLFRALTRGDGQAGEDITAKIPTGTVGLPRTTRLATSIIVRGELVFTREQFAAANEFRVAEGKPAFVNARNALAGSVRRDDLPADERPPMTFFAYSAVVAEDHTALVNDLDGDYFETALHLGIDVAGLGIHPTCSLDEVKARIAAIGDHRSDFPCDIDGAVIKIDSVKRQHDAGATGAHPRWALAWKYAAEEASTTLLAIDVQIGRTGVHTPVARLDPVFVGGTTVTNVTLHNPSDLEARDVRPGDTVVVRRAGDVIPEITGHIQRPADSVPWDMPTDCLRCGSELDQSEKRWRCVNRDCTAGAGALLVYACSRDALDIEGAAEGTITALLEAGLVRDLADLAELTVDQVAGLPGFGEVSARNLIDGVAAAKNQPLHRLVTALGIRMTGRRMSKRLAAHFGTLEALRDAYEAKLVEVEGIGDRRAVVIRAELSALDPLLDRLVAQGWNTFDENHGVERDEADLPLAGETVVVTGSVPGYGRNEVNDLIERLGGKSSGSVSKNTTLLISAGPGSSKHTKAVDLGIRIESPEWLAGLAGG